jgi:hypothetical protein
LSIYDVLLLAVGTAEAIPSTAKKIFNEVKMVSLLEKSLYETKSKSPPAGGLSTEVRKLPSRFKKGQA